MIHKNQDHFTEYGGWQMNAWTNLASVLIKLCVLLMIVLFCRAACAAGTENSMCNSKSDKKADATDDYTVACYYFPNYHPGDARNDKDKGKGWCEWELVKDAKPRFPGHHQPNVPLWGYVDESDPNVMAKKIDAAADHGIDAFIFDWYWYEDGPFLDRCLERGYLKAANNNRVKFSLMWANHTWQDIQPKTVEGEPKNLYDATISLKTYDYITSYIIEHYFKHPSHWKIDGKPYFSIYDINRFVADFGGLENAAKQLNRFREKTVAAGFQGLHLNAVVWQVKILPNETAVKNANELIKYLGFDSVTSYVWIHHVPLPKFPQTPYQYVMDKYFEYAEKTSQEFDVPYYPNATMGWDSSPRAGQNLPFEGRGYPFMATMSDNTPQAFKQGLTRIKAFLDKQPEDQRIMNINCWNEWTEGSYLEPDTIHGIAYLQAVKEVFSNK